MSVLKLKDENGKWVGIPTIKGDKGDDGTYVEGNPNVDATDGDLTKIKIDNKIYIIHNYTSAINAKQDTLVSGENIKTINGQSILGSGNISISGSGNATVRISGTATSGSLSDDDWNKLKNMSVLAIHYGDKIYYLGYNDFANSMRYYPYKPDDGFSEQYISVPHSAPKWAFTQHV